MSETATVTDIFDKARNHERVEQLRWARENDYLPYFRPMWSKMGPTVIVDGRECLMMGSNCYLGLTSNERVQAAARAALEQYGTGLTGSRLMNGTTRLHEELESEIADWMGTESALAFSTGYQANLGCISSLVGPGDTVICDRLDHASIHDACKLSGATVRRFEHGSMEQLEEYLVEASSDEGGVLVVVDGVYSMEGEVIRLDQVVEVCNRYSVRLMVDEAHAVGVFGQSGTGTCELFGLEDQVDLRMGTFSKSLASCGGFIAAEADVIDYMRFACGPFLFTASSVPAAVGATLEAVRICRSSEGAELFGRVLDNARYLHTGLSELGFHINKPTEVPGVGEVLSPIVPVLIGDDIQAALFWHELYNNGVYTNAAHYPSVPRDGALIRTSVMASHEHTHLDQAIAAFAQAKEKFPDIPSGEPPRNP